jgi:hypothetical protein
MENDDRIVSRLRHNIVLQHILDMTHSSYVMVMVMVMTAGGVTWEGAKISSRLCYSMFKNETNSVALVCERTILTKRPPLVGEVSANFCG